MATVAAATPPRVLALFGATGNTGRYVLPLALDAGWRVNAMLRNPAKLPVSDPALVKIKGDLQNAEAIEATVKGADAVIWLAGHPRGTPMGFPGDAVMSSGVEKVCDAMEKHGVRKLIVQVGGFTLLEGEAPPPALLRWCMMDLYLKGFLGETVALADNQRIADNLQKRSAAIDWTLARPGMLKHGGDATTVRAVVDTPSANATVTFYDLAKWELGMLERDAVKHRGLFPGYAAPKKTGALLVEPSEEQAPSHASFFSKLDGAATTAAAAAVGTPDLAWVLVDAKGVKLGSGKTPKASWQGMPAELKANAVLATLAAKGGAPDAWTTAMKDPAKLTPCGSACGICLVLGCCGCCVPGAFCGVSMPVAACCTKKFYVKGGVALTLPSVWAGDATFAVAGANDANDDEKVATQALEDCGYAYDPATARWKPKPNAPVASSMHRA